MKELGIFEGKVEVSARMQISGVDNRLRTPLSALPRAWESGERIPVLLWVTVGNLRHDPLAESPGWVRVHFTDADEAIVLDHVEQSLLDDLAEAQRDAVRAWEREQLKAKNEAKGIIEFPGLEESNGDRPEGMSDGDWEASAKAQAPATLASKRQKKAEAQADA